MALLRLIPLRCPWTILETSEREKSMEKGLESMPQLLDTKQAAEILNVNVRTVARMCEQGKLKAVKVMSLWRINRDRLLDFAGLN